MLLMKELQHNKNSKHKHLVNVTNTKERSTVPLYLQHKVFGIVHHSSLLYVNVVADVQGKIKSSRNLFELSNHIIFNINFL